MASTELAEKLSEMNVSVNASGVYELNKMTKEQYLQFRYIWIEKRAHNQLWKQNTNAKAMDLLLSIFVLILCKKIPTDLGIIKLDGLHTKVKLLCPTHFNKEASQKPETAVIRLISVALPKPTSPTSNNTSSDNDNTAWAMNGRVSSLPYTVSIINQKAAKVCREDFMNWMAKQCPDFFKDESKPTQQILSRAQEMSFATEEQYLGNKCSTYDLPYFDIQPTEYDI